LDLDLTWTCACCGQQYDKLSVAYSVRQPDLWASVPEEEEQQHGSVLGTDSCVIDQKHHFIRGRIVIPVIDCEEPFIWGLWASVSQQSFVRFGQLWDVDIREHEPPLPGRIGNDIPLYPTTTGLECRIMMKNARRRPSFELSSPDHPLAIEQRNGIMLDRVKEIASLVQRHSR
jgi:hypothetical protein